VNVGVLASGVGTNLQALIDEVHGRDRVAIVAVGSENPRAMALERARGAGIETESFPESEFAGDRVKRDVAMADWLVSKRVELVVLAGYMRLLAPAFLDRFPNRVINIHPALLPAFPGLDAVQQAIDYGVKVFGATVHFVDEGTDTGPVIVQRAMTLPDGIDAWVATGLLRPIEHQLLCEAVRLIAAGCVRFDERNPRATIVTPVESRDAR
jgi:phosphoribosylglycinamide formyltransferase-1